MDEMVWILVPLKAGENSGSVQNDRVPVEDSTRARNTAGRTMISLTKASAAAWAASGAWRREARM